MKNLKLWGAMHFKSESVGYHLFRRNGQDAFNFVHFHDPVGIVSGGIPIETEPHACILYTPHNLQEYYALNAKFSNDFVTFHVDDPEFIHQYNLIQNEVFYIEEPERITEIVEYISWTMTDKELDHTNTLPDHIHQLLDTLSRCQILNSPAAQRAYQAKKRFISLREEVAKNPGPWDVEKMAKAVFLTRSYFYTQYKAHFGVSPSDDLIAMTIAHGKGLLTETHRSIAEVAAACGYARTEYFIRLFKQREGMTPGQFRRNLLRQEE